MEVTSLARVIRMVKSEKSGVMLASLAENNVRQGSGVTELAALPSHYDEPRIPLLVNIPPSQPAVTSAPA